MVEFIETWLKWANDALFVKKLSSEFFKCIIVMFQLAHDFTPLASNGSLYLLPVLIQNLCILHQNQLKFATHYCTAGLLRIN